jgi:predicted ester cyclase
MTAEQNKAIVRRYFEEIHKRNLAVLDELLAPGYVEHTPLPFPPTPGRTGTIEIAQAALRAAPDGWHTIKGQVADGEYVLTVVEAGGTFKDDLFHLKATGKPIGMAGITLHRVVDGKLVEHWGVSDFPSLLQQIGVMPGPPEKATPAPMPAPPARSGRAPTREEAERILQRFGNLLTSNDDSDIDEIVAPDFYANFIGLPLMPNRDAWLATVRGFLGGFSNFHLTIEQGLIEGEYAAANYTWTARHTGEVMGVAATGKTVQVRGLGMYRILDGRLVEEQVIEDVMALLVQLGVVPGPAEEQSVSAG